MAWNKDASGFYYTRYPQGNERPIEDANFYQQVYFHKLGTPASSDTYVIGKDFPRIAEIKLSTTDDGRYLLVSVANGDGGEFAHYFLNPAGQCAVAHEFECRPWNRNRAERAYRSGYGGFRVSFRRISDEL